MKAIITVGIPGSGKTTWAESQSNYVNINLDDLRAKVSGDAADQNATTAALELQQALIIENSSKGNDIIISDTHLKPAIREYIIGKLEAVGYEVEIVVFPINDSIARERNEKRTRAVPVEIMDRLISTFNENPVTQPHSICFHNKKISNELVEPLLKLVSLGKHTPSIKEMLFENELSDYITLSQGSWYPKPELSELLSYLGFSLNSIQTYIKFEKMDNIINFLTYSEELLDLDSFIQEILPYEMSENMELFLKEKGFELKKQAKFLFDDKFEVEATAQLIELTETFYKSI